MKNNIKFMDVLSKKERVTSFLERNKNAFIPSKFYDHENINDSEGGGVICVNSDLELRYVYQYDAHEYNEWCKFSDIYFDNDASCKLETFLHDLNHNYDFIETDKNDICFFTDVNKYNDAINKIVANYFYKKGFSHKEIMWSLYNCENLNHDFHKIDQTLGLKKGKR